ncbi:type I polyketide synthase, partial [Dactylosporangium sp. NPDC000555]|uniref:type I polyketide synthase n=1 Tax=Dactylosporangium sp. NPDC000555 TaxID=3154260 RepID=UPI00331E1A10
AGISSFGISGTNAHLILEEPPTTNTNTPTAEPVEQPLAFVLSARSETALHRQADRLAGFLADHPTVPLASVARSLTGRARFDQRAVLVAEGHGELRQALTALAAGMAGPGVVTGTAGRPGPTVFVFPGQGSQWTGMARALMAESPVFRERIHECAAALSAYVDWDLVATLSGSEAAADLDRVDVIQPALWSVMVSLAAVWESWSVRPDAVIGHSQGEIAAAVVAGALTIGDGARVVALRSQALRAITGPGGMASVPLPADRVRERIAGTDVSIAAVNGPSVTVLSGSAVELAELVAAYEADGVRARIIPVDYASHSAHVDAIRDEVLRLLDGIQPRTAPIAFYSTVEAERVDTAGLSADYWMRNLRQTVRFGATVERLLTDGYGVFVECSAHPVLTGGMQQVVEASGADRVVVGSLRRDDGGLRRMLTSVAELHTGGGRVDWGRVLPAAPLTQLPTYAFEHAGYWMPAATGTAAAGDGPHPLLTGVVERADGQGVLFTGQLSARSQKWLADHAVFGSVLLPGAAFVDLAVRAGDHVGCGTIEELIIDAPLVVPDGAVVALQVLLAEPDEQGRRHLEVYGQAGDAPWRRHAVATMVAARPEATAAGWVWPPDHTVDMPVSDAYPALAGLGLQYGPAFQGLRAVRRGGADVYVEAELPDAAGAGDFGIHPALLDAVLHGLAFSADGAETRLPFSWSGVTLSAVGAGRVRARISPAGEDAYTLDVVDAAGAAVLRVDALAVRPMRPAQVAEPAADDLLALDWAPTPGVLEAAEPGAAPTLLGGDPLGLADLWPQVRQATSVDDTVAHGDAAGAVLTVVSGEPVREALERVLALLQAWIDDERLADRRLVVVTRGALATHPGEEVADPAAAAVWGLVRSAQTEHPGRFVLLDVDGRDASLSAMAAAVASGESQMALRADTVLVPRLRRAADLAGLPVPDGDEPWQLDASVKGSLDRLALVPCPEANAPLAEGQVRLAVRAAGLNFRDILITLGMVVDDGRPAASEGAGVVLEVGPGVTGLRPGDEVMGLIGRIGPVSVADSRLLAPKPASWTFAEAAGAPVVFLTALYGLRDLARVRSGERLLIHAATGGVGMAATQLARHYGLEVYATASPAKWDTLRAMGYPATHIASSRTLDFEQAFAGGVDVVLNSLAGDYVDASLRLLGDGGRFIEMGKTDIRDAAEVAAVHPGVRYAAFDVMDPGPDYVHSMLRDLLELAEQGVVTPLRMTAFDIRQAPAAFRYLSQARHTGKVVLTLPTPFDTRGTALVTGATGTLGGHIARHLVTRHGVRNLLLVSRQGPRHPSAAALTAELEGLGAHVTLAAADTGDAKALRRLLDGIDPRHPLSTVVHTAGVLADATVDRLTGDLIGTALRPKADSVDNLDRLTRDHPLTHFVVFSSAAGTMGTAGQGAYAAANAYLDAVAQRRRARGLPAASIAWGLWADASGMTGHLSDTDRQRMGRGGFLPLATEQGLDLFDAAITADRAVVVAARTDMQALREHAPALLGVLDRQPVRRVADSAGADGASALQARLTGRTRTEQTGLLAELVRDSVAAVLGFSGATPVHSDRTFKELGFDSLTALELRNRLNAATRLRLPATLVFDHPTVDALAGHLCDLVAPEPVVPAATVLSELDRFEAVLADLETDDDQHQRIAARIQALLWKWNSGQSGAGDNPADSVDLDLVSDDDLFHVLDNELGLGQ